tara:strand:+ start:506 stop:661 length:156 start_codon:yes stop_codon:yes gene_type:complete
MNDKNSKTIIPTARPSGAFNLGVMVGDKDNWRSRNNTKPLVTRKATIPNVR